MYSCNYHWDWHAAAPVKCSQPIWILHAAKCFMSAFSRLWTSLPSSYKIFAPNRGGNFPLFFDSSGKIGRIWKITSFIHMNISWGENSFLCVKKSLNEFIYFYEFSGSTTIVKCHIQNNSPCVSLTNIIYWSKKDKEKDSKKSRCIRLSLSHIPIKKFMNKTHQQYLQ